MWVPPYSQRERESRACCILIHTCCLMYLQSFILLPLMQPLTPLPPPPVYDDKMPGAKVSVVLQLGYDTIYSETVEREEHQFPLGTLSIAPETSWVTMDTKICDIFMVSEVVNREQNKGGHFSGVILVPFMVDISPSLTKRQVKLVKQLQ